MEQPPAESGGVSVSTNNLKKVREEMRTKESMPDRYRVFRSAWSRPIGMVGAGTG